MCLTARTQPGLIVVLRFARIAICPMDDEGPDRVRASYRDNFARLVEVKRRYDPENAFHVNQNIAPDAALQ